MNPSVKRDLTIEQLQQGMTLAANIMDRDGKVIALKDTVLTDKFIDRLKKFFSGNSGFKVSVIEAPQKKKSPLEIKKEELEQAINRMFEPYSEHKLYQFLKNLTLKSSEYLLDKNPELYE
ncbi:MAG TPA: hypothetical protein PKY81_08725 [bacterium]|nr:hypothetical protein [bacterium]HPN31028.1 hypothetical protein [bacterium]